MRSETVDISTGSEAVVVDLTSRCERFLDSGDERDGLLNVFVPHATAGLAVIEVGAGSDEDLLAAIGSLLPDNESWRHRHGSRGHGRDHVLPAFVAPSLTIPVIAGRMQLGTWQSVCLVDTNRDNTRRSVRFSFVEG